MANVINYFRQNWRCYRRNLSQNLRQYADSGLNYTKKVYNIDLKGQCYKTLFGVIYAAIGVTSDKT